MPEEKSASMGSLKNLAEDIAMEKDPQRAQAKLAMLIMEMDAFRRIEHNDVLKKIAENKKEASEDINAVAIGVSGILVSLNGNGDIKKGLRYKVTKNADDIAVVKKWSYVIATATVLWLLNSIFGLIAI